MKRLPLLTLALAALAGVIHAIPAVTATLELNRTAVIQGELWRLWTGHLTHFGGEHLRWDVLTFVPLGAFMESLCANDKRQARRRLAVLLGMSALAISLCIICFQPRFAHYRGLSGIDSALFAWVMIHVMKGAWAKRHTLTLCFGGCSLAAFIAKCSFELVTGTAVFANGQPTLFEPVPLAHLVGAAVGVAATIAPTWEPRSSSIATGAG